MPSKPSGGNTGRTVALVTVAVVGVAVLALAAFLLLPFGDDDDNGGSQENGLPANALTQEWAVPVTVSSGVTTPLPKMWFVEDAVVVGEPRLGLRAYDIRSGKQLWELERPKGAGELCAMSSDVSSGGTGAVAFDAGGDHCGVIAAVETDTGEVLWARKAGDYGTQREIVEVNSETVVSTAGGYVKAYDVRTGEERVVPRERGYDCASFAVPSRDYIISTSTCSETKPRHLLTVTDVATGNDKVWKHPNEPLEIGRVLADRPLTALFEDEDDNRHLLVFTDGEDGKADKILHRWELTGELEALQFGDNPAFVTEDAVLVAEHQGGDRQIAVDLKTGKVLWKSPRGIQRMVGMDPTDGTVLVAHQAPYKDGMVQHVELFTYDARSGERKSVGSLAVPKQGLSLVDITLGWDGRVVYVLQKSADGKATLRAFSGV